MNPQGGRSRALRWLSLSALAIVLLLAAGAFWGWNRRSHPQSLVGQWTLDDLRSEAVEASPVTFGSTGVYDADDPAVATRWRFADGQIHIRYWKKKGGFPLSEWFTDTAVYAWMTGADEFPLTPQFNDDRTVMTLAFPGEKPHVRLRRSGADVERNN